MSAPTSTNLPRGGSISDDGFFGFDGAEGLLRAWGGGLKPDPLLTVSGWADRYRMLSSRAAAEPGRYRTKRTPYMKEIMDALSPGHPAQRIVFMKAAQVGATEAGSCFLGFIIHQAPGPALAVQPTVELAKRNSRQRIDPLIEESPALRDKVKPARSRDAGNTMLSKEFAGGILIMTGANSAVGLRSTPARYIFLDEVDAYLRGNVEGGEGFDWFYLSDADRAAQVRTPITDGAHGRPWVFRYKDLRAWWSNPHRNRPGGVESGSPTAWVPESKPIRFTEIGCPAVDRGPNQPNVFYDPKSAESFLPLLAAQAQKHVTVNEALRLLDGLVQLAVLNRHLTAPPASPADGDRYIVGSGATGAWAGWDLNVALWTDGAWLRLPPRTGWRAWVEDEDVLLVYDGASWTGTTPATLQNMALLGLGTTADASNPFSAKLNAALWTAKTVAEGGTGDLFYTMNKEAAGDDLGLTLQTGFVTKALVGLFGSDRFRLAVSADGSTFFDGLSVDNANGIVDQPRLPRFKAYTNYDNYVGIGTWTKIGLNNTDYNDQGAFDAANNHFVAPVDGTYLFGATLLYKINASATARMRGRLVLNGTTEIPGSLGEISATHVSLATAIWLQTMVPLTAGDTVELQGYFRVADGYFAADHTSFWGCKIG